MSTTGKTSDQGSRAIDIDAKSSPPMEVDITSTLKKTI